MISGVYTQNKVRLILDMASHSNILNFNSPRLFLRSGGLGVTFLESILHQVLEEKGSSLDRKGLIAEIQKAREAHRLNIPRIREKLELKEEGVKVKVQEREEEKNPLKKETIQNEIRLLDEEIQTLRSFVTDSDEYDWAVICKCAMQKGKILSDSPECTAAIKILLEEIKTLWAHFQKTDMFKSAERGAKPIAKFNKEYIRALFLNFMGQLCVINEGVSAEIIHNYLHLAYQTWQAVKENKWLLPPENRLNISDISMTFAPGLCEGLTLFKQMMALSAPKDEIACRNEQKELYHFFQLITAELINASIFDKPFNKDFYSHFSQAKVLVEQQTVKEEERVSSPSRNSMTLALKLDALSLSSPRKVVDSPRKPKSPIVLKPAVLKASSTQEVASNIAMVESVVSESPTQPRAITSSRNSGTLTPGYDLLATVAMGRKPAEVLSADKKDQRRSSKK